MEIKLQKQPQKYLASVDAPTRKKLWAALEKLKELDGEGHCPAGRHPKSLPV